MAVAVTAHKAGQRPALPAVEKGALDLELAAAVLGSARGDPNDLRNKLQERLGQGHASAHRKRCDSLLGPVRGKLFDRDGSGCQRNEVRGAKSATTCFW